jgi:C-terminal processing protease CtpA/Prc
MRSARRLRREPIDLGRERPVIAQHGSASCRVRSAPRGVSIDGTNVVKTPSKDILRMIRGAPGTTVKLELSDPARSKTNQFTVKRGKAVIESGSVVKITDQ